VAFFQERTAGADPDRLLFQRETYDRKQKDPRGTWSRAELSRTMVETCATAALEPLVFHELRHTYASGLVNRGVPLVFVAMQLGHRDTSMVELHYGHLCQHAKAEAVRKLAPVLGIHQPAAMLVLDPKTDGS
jgi:integrase